jgi:hypothetical protein
MDQSQYFKVRSYGLSLFIVTEGFALRGAVVERDGQVAYLFDEEAAHAIPAFQKVRAPLDAARDEALAAHHLAQQSR